MELKAAGITDVGLKRESNEDYFSIDNALGLYIVADGMGGHLAGEVASKVAVEVINKNVNRWISQNTPDDELFDYPDSALSKRGNYILSGIKLANRVIYELSKVYSEYKGMGTTIVVLSVTASLTIASNVGDSRLYLIRGNTIEPLSKEHNMVTEQLEMGLISEEEAEVSPLRHILTRNLGSSDTVDVDVFEIEPRNNDRFLLCTDGLTDLVSDKEILEIVQNGEDPEHLCRQLIVKANAMGGNDNVTASLIFVHNLEQENQGIVKKFWSRSK
ncbi:MAG: Stp1/IreP family PP2C-type Ser/Thr phosphatase [Proteobacteria bacterium]|nr:Stp1/IreP family PP2C-type Ser/Thr phosphatase [Pseudomonadota bacterium]